MKTLEPIFPKKHVTKDFRVSMTAKGVAKCIVLDSKTGEVVREYPEQNNLILNQGMDNIAVTSWAGNFAACAAGTGTTPTSDDSGTTTASRAGTTVTLSGGSFLFTNTATDAGKMIKWDSGEEARIVTITSTTVAEVATSGTIAAAEFIVFRTNQTGLTTEVKRTTTYLTGSGNCETTINSGAGSVSHKRTFDFTAEVGSVTYNELGWSSNASAGNNLFSRILLGAGVALVASQQLRVVYTLTITLSPVTDTTVAVSPITGASGATGHQQIQYPSMGFINSSDGSTTTNFPGGFGLEVTASATSATIICTQSTTFQSFGSAGPTRTGTNSSNGTLSSYTALSFTRTKTTVFTTGTANATNWRSLRVSDLVNQAFVYIFDTDFTKDNVHTLTINLIITWGRTLA